MNNKNYHFKQNLIINQNPFQMQMKPSLDNKMHMQNQNQSNKISSSTYQGNIYENKNYNSGLNHNNQNNNNVQNVIHKKKNFEENSKKMIRDPFINEPNFHKLGKANSYNNVPTTNLNINNFNNENSNQMHNYSNSPNFNVTKNKFLTNFNPPNLLNNQDRVIAFGQDKSENNFKKTLRKPAISNLIQNSSLNILNPNPVITNSAFSNSFRNHLINTINNNNLNNNNTNPYSNSNGGSADPSLLYSSLPFPSTNALNSKNFASALPGSNYSSNPNNCNINSYNLNSDSYSINSTTSNSKESYSYGTNNHQNQNSYFVKDASSVKEYAYKEDPNYKYRGAMEDMSKCIDKFMNNSDVGLFTLYDGHGGGEIAQYLKNRLPDLFSKILSPLNNKFESDDLNYDIENSINTLFNKLDDEIKLTSESEYMGSTAVVVLICKERDYISPLTSRKVIYCANVGDSRGVLISNFGVKRLSYDHKASDISEINRVNGSGGLIFNGRVFGQLIITRAFGDHSLKRYGVIATPHITKHFINDKDKFLVLASDGVWDVIADEDLLKLSQSVTNADDLAKLIIKTSLLRGTQDNISCIVLKL